uniref:Uncharacterized protein LOC111109741 isoform X2 n=1 Tax=Crassostrea virginica TaxID=6565 RepID=A0A8B8BFU8_CRAVI|nr:uncharacterized protein LOC111109741 isoform X2 [Crassostrea virginica]
MEIKSELVEYFPYDEETTDVVIRVDDKRMHLSRGTLMQASPVFRKMLNSNGKEKQAEITLPEKSYEEVVLFLRCISPREFVKLDEESIDVVLPLAHEYQVKATLQKCEDWLLTEIKFIVGEVTGHTKETQEKVEFFAKCLLYGTKHDLETLYNRALELLVPYKLSRYQHTEFYKLLPDKQKSQLLETRMVKIEETNKIGDGNFLQTITPPNIPSQASMFGVSASVSENAYNSTPAFGSRGSRR